MPHKSDSFPDSGNQSAQREGVPSSHLFQAMLALAGILDSQPAEATLPGQRFDLLRQALGQMEPSEAKRMATLLSKHIIEIDAGLAARVAHVLVPVALLDPEALAKPWCDLTRNTLPPQQQKWLTRWLSGYAADMVSQAACGAMAEEDARADLLAAAVGTARHEGWPEDMGRLAAEGAWRYAEQRFAAFRAKLRSRVWPMGKSREPGGMIMLAAREVDDEFGWMLPTPLLEDAARRIALAAAVPYRPRRAYRG